MGSCTSCCAREPVGGQDAGKPGVTVVKVILSTGMEVPVYALPSDTMRDISNKVETAYGRQPNVAVKGRSVPPRLHAKHNKQWVPLQWEATLQQVQQTEFKYSDITDILKKVQVASHVHWAASQAFAIAS